MVKLSSFTMARSPSVSNHWFCKTPNCHTPLACEEHYTGRLYRNGAYCGYCLFDTVKKMLPGEILVDGGWKAQKLHCIGCNTLLGGKFIQVPPDRAGQPSKVGRVFLKIAKVSFGDGSSTIDGEAAIAAEPVFKHPETMAQPEVSVQPDGGDWVHLNVGGKKFCTTVDTLTRQPSSMLAKMFCGNYKLKRSKGYVFIDRDGKNFGHILRWLRDSAIPEMNKGSYEELLLEADYYQLPDLRKTIEGLVLQCNADMCRKEVIAKMECNKGLCLRGLNLYGLNLSKLQLENVDLQGACLQFADFEGAKLKRVDLQNCDATNAVFKNALLEESILSKGNFTDASFVSAHFLNVKAEECIFDSANCEGCELSGAKLGSSSFQKANLCDANLSRTDLSKADLYQCVLSNANLQEAELKEAVLAGAVLEGAQLQRADMKDAELGRANLLIAKNGGANVEGAF